MEGKKGKRQNRQDFLPARVCQNSLTGICDAERSEYANMWFLPQSTCMLMLLYTPSWASHLHNLYNWHSQTKPHSLHNFPFFLPVYFALCSFLLNLSFSKCSGFYFLTEQEIGVVCLFSRMKQQVSLCHWLDPGCRKDFVAQSPSVKWKY